MISAGFTTVYGVKSKNPRLNFNFLTYEVACGKAAIFQTISNKGISYELPIKYVKASIHEERSPYNKG